ncbi:ParA family protein [Sporomusa sp.]|uniref:ParA family protein n=1 Tax=Sporomusa sp. TaxID=2078658 RepID=UPI002C824885|nr:ParA family protein [Sporomusa sp.]HWR05822.1 ParA family protein [Sporomusa sp.]
MKIISIANRKGGVGKTVISGNIAYELSKMGTMVLMVDLDSQCDLSKIYLPGATKAAASFICSASNAGLTTLASRLARTCTSFLAAGTLGKDEDQLINVKSFSDFLFKEIYA